MDVKLMNKVAEISDKNSELEKKNLELDFELVQ